MFNPIKQQLHGHLPTISKTIQIRQKRYAGHFWRCEDELMSDILLWKPSHGRARVGQPARTYLLHICTDTGCSLEDLQEAMDDKDEWREIVREIRAYGIT